MFLPECAIFSPFISFSCILTAHDFVRQSSSRPFSVGVSFSCWTVKSIDYLQKTLRYSVIHFIYSFNSGYIDLKQQLRFRLVSNEAAETRDREEWTRVSPLCWTYVFYHFEFYYSCHHLTFIFVVYCAQAAPYNHQRVNLERKEELPSMQ